MHSGVVKGERRSPIFFLGGEAIPPNDIRTRGSRDTVAFHQIGLQRNAKSVVKVNSSFIEVKCLISCIILF